jgi:methanol:N,N-dimethyl-4-nitrosoaniline oxidoreductase
MVNKNVFEFPIAYTSAIPKIAYGWGAYETAGDECKALGMKKVLIVTTGLKGTGVIDEIKGSLNYHGIATEVYDKVTSNPKDWQVMEAYKLFKESDCDGVVSIGGGSSHDTGKCVRAVAANKGMDVGNFAAYLDPPWMEEQKKYKGASVPQVAINTTAGTGAEVTPIAAITNTKLRAKQLIIVPNIACSVAIIDPLLIRLCPKHIAAWAGFDAMTHAFETYITRVRSPYTPGVSLEAIKMLSESLRDFVYSRANPIACEKVCWSSTMGGLAIAFGSGAGMVHGIAHQLSALTDAHHGLANAVMTPVVERYNQPSRMDRFGDMAKAMGVDTRNMTAIQASDAWFIEIERMLKDLNITPGNLHAQFGLDKKDFPHMIKIFSNDFSKDGNPVEYDYDKIYKLLETMY